MRVSCLIGLGILLVPDRVPRLTDLAHSASFISVREAWIVAGVLDGGVAYPRLAEDVCGVPHGLRVACDLALAGAKRIFVIWNADEPAPDLSRIAHDERLARHAELVVVREPPPGDGNDEILVARADRLFHRDMPKLVLAAHRTTGGIGKVRGSEHDAVFAMNRTTARRFMACAHEPAGMARELDGAELAEVDVPYAGFTARASGPRSLRRAERQLVYSLRKAADGIAAKALNRHISLPISHALSRTAIHPNHVTIAALVIALCGASVIATGGYLAGVVGMLLVELGSIIDGVDGELARLRFQFSRTGQWLDTTVDDVANCAYATGIMLNLASAGATWAVPLGCAALAAFVITQGVQYSLIKVVYKSGDLAAIPWAFQSADFLAKTSLRATLPKLLKRDFVVTLFTVFAIAGQLDWILYGFAAGAFAFFGVFFVQLARHWRELPTS